MSQYSSAAVYSSKIPPPSSAPSLSTPHRVPFPSHPSVITSTTASPSTKYAGKGSQLWRDNSLLFCRWSASHSFIQSVSQRATRQLFSAWHDPGKLFEFICGGGRTPRQPGMGMQMRSEFPRCCAAAAWQWDFPHVLSLKINSTRSCGQRDGWRRLKERWIAASQLNCTTVCASCRTHPPQRSTI